VTARRRVRALIAAGVAIVLVVAVLVVGELVARRMVEQRVRETIVSELDLPADQPIDVGVGGIVLAQLIAGRLDDLSVRSDDVSIGGLSGDVAIRAHGVPVRGEDLDALGGTASIALDAADVDALLAQAGGRWLSWGDIDVALPGPAAELSTSASLFGVPIPLAFSAVPGVQDGDVVLTPESIRVGGLELTADTLAQAPIDLSALSQPLVVCDGDALPDGLEVVSADVEHAELVVRLSLADGAATDTGAWASAGCV